MLNILLADNDYTYIENIFNKISLKLKENFDIIEICSSGDKVLEYILNTKIDIIILELNLPKVGGIDILKELKKRNINIPTIILSKNSDLVFKVIKENINYYKILPKPFDIENLIEILKKISNNSIKNESKKRIISLLNNFNFNKSSVGYTYLIDILNFCIENEIKYINNLKNIYQKLELKYNKNLSYKKIEWNIEKSIRTMNNYTDPLILNKYFSYTNFPSSKVFINGLLYIYYDKF